MCSLWTKTSFFDDQLILGNTFIGRKACIYTQIRQVSDLLSTFFDIYQNIYNLIII